MSFLARHFARFLASTRPFSSLGAAIRPSFPSGWHRSCENYYVQPGIRHPAELIPHPIKSPANLTVRATRGLIRASLASDICGLIATSPVASSSCTSVRSF
jgi:hypothetical protein